MRMKGLETPMNADDTPMAAEEGNETFRVHGVVASDSSKFNLHGVYRRSSAFTAFLLRSRQCFA